MIIKRTEMFHIWEKFNRDNNYRFAYDLNEHSIVFDLGGYKGEWTEKILQMYSCEIHIFELCEQFYINIKNKFADNYKIKINNFGLSNCTKETLLYIDNDKTTIHYDNIIFNNDKPITVGKAKLIDFFDYIMEYKIEHIDLMKVNIEGEEYNLMEYILENNYVNNIRNIQIQFHANVENYLERMITIQNKLRNTHVQTYCFPTIWENWSLK